MGDSKKKYWTGLEELHQTPEFVQASNKEFSEELPVEEFLNDERLGSATTGRRDFLKFLGFGLGAATLAACEAPVIKSIPYVTKPEEITPGIANYYASSYFDGYDFASVLVKTREGRPIFIKGNKQYGLAGGRINARVSASVLSLYDSQRLQHPVIDGARADLDEMDTRVINAVQAAMINGQKVRLLTNTVNSPAAMAAIEKFGESVAEQAGGMEDVFRHVQYEPISYAGMLEANQESFGRAFIPDYDFTKARTIVSVSADFLNDWLFANEYSGDYIANRRPENGWMSNHFQFEALMTLTGTNADVRTPIKPSQEGLIVASIYNFIASQTGNAGVSINTSEVDGLCRRAAEKLLADRGQSLVVAGSNSKGIQVLVNGINNMLGNYGSTISTTNELNLNKAYDRDIQSLMAEMNSGEIGLVIIAGVNPAYSLDNSEDFRQALAKVTNRVALSLYMDETASLCNIVCADNHYLESWNDHRIKSDFVGMAQPAISKLYESRQLGESMLKWSGSDQDFYGFMQATWSGMLSGIAEGLTFSDDWNRAIHDGGMRLSAPSLDLGTFAGNVSAAASEANALAQSAGGEFEMVFYTKAGIGNGSHIANPWLQELPDPVTKITWDNYVTMAPTDMRERGYNEYLGERHPATVAVFNIGGREMRMPVVPVPGQKPGTLGLSLGYGRGANGEKIGKAAFQTAEYGGYLTKEDGLPKPIGFNAYPLVTKSAGGVLYHNFEASISGTDGTYPLASSQTHHTIMDRTSVLRETDLATFNTADRADYNPVAALAFHGAPVKEGAEPREDHKVPVKDINIWNEHPVNNAGHRWGMSIDLNACIGCGSCVVSCHIENNVPVVGKDEVRRARDMFWMRIDRYYSSDMSHEKAEEQGLGTIETYRKMEVPEENPKVVHMPMFCQHCNHAPCETVCPVVATTHSNEGLNQMTYNRCIGTRYCANNCPYKVRRFNWFNYMGYKKFREVNPSQDATMRMVLNPDVTVRARGVMEKCSMCVQRIQAGKLDAKKAGKPVVDGSIQTACAEACPTDAITFGDVNDTNSQVRKNHESKRGYYALEEIGIRPNIAYMVKVRNEEESTEA